MPSQRALQLDNRAGFLSWLLVQSHGRPLLNERWAGAALLCGWTFLAFALLLLLPHYIGMSELTELASRAVAALRDPVPMELLIHFHRALPAVSYKVPFLHPAFSVRCVWGEGGGMQAAAVETMAQFRTLFRSAGQNFCTVHCCQPLSMVRNAAALKNLGKRGCGGYWEASIWFTGNSNLTELGIFACKSLSEQSQNKEGAKRPCKSLLELGFLQPKGGRSWLQDASHFLLVFYIIKHSNSHNCGMWRPCPSLRL